MRQVLYYYARAGALCKSVHVYTCIIEFLPKYISIFLAKMYILNKLRGEKKSKISKWSKKLCVYIHKSS